jgi:hypothetical protein
VANSPQRLLHFFFGSDLDDQAVVVVDPKGEIAQAAGPSFESLCIQAERVCARVRRFLSLITANNPNYVDDARALADV